MAHWAISGRRGRYRIPVPPPLLHDHSMTEIALMPDPRVSAVHGPRPAPAAPRREE